MSERTEQWVLASSDGPVELHPDGSFGILGNTFDQSTAFSHISFGDLRMDKPAGEGQLLTLQARGKKKHVLKYEQGRWWARTNASETEPIGRRLVTRIRMIPATPWAITAVIGLLVLLGAGFALSRPANKAEKTAPQKRDETPLIVTEAEREAKELQERAIRQANDKKRRELEAAENEQAEGRVLAQATLQRIADRGTQILGSLREFNDELKGWNDAVPPLLANDSGKYIAADESLTAAFRKIYEGRRPAQGESDAIRARVELLLQPIQKALVADDISYVPSQKLLSQLEDEGKSVLVLIDSYREPRRQIEALLAQAKRANAPSSLTLERAMREFDAKNAAEQAQLITQSEEEARRESDEKLAAARAEKVRQDAANEIATINAEKAAEQVRADNAAKATLEAAERERRIALAKSEEVRKLLYPFFASGHWQPPNRLTSEKWPVSYSALRSYGALQPNNKGLKALYQCGNSVVDQQSSPDRDRPRWGYSKIFVDLPQDQILQLRKAQGYLRDLGETFVELGMLSP